MGIEWELSKEVMKHEGVKFSKYKHTVPKCHNLNFIIRQMHLALFIVAKQ